VNSGHPLFFRASTSCSKILNVKIIFHTAKNFWATLFFIASSSCSKILNDRKGMFNAVKNIRAPCFSGQAHAHCSKLLNVKSIFHTVQNCRTRSVFRGKRRLLKNSECKKYNPHSEKFMSNSVFQGKRKLLKIPECIMYIQYSEKFHDNSVF